MVLSRETNESSDESNSKAGSSPSLAEGKKITQYLAAMVVNLAAFCNGAVIGWASPMVPVLQSEDSPLDQGAINTDEGSWLSSLVCLGAIVATVLYLYLTHYLSRKLTGYLVAVPFILTWILVIYAKSVPLLYLHVYVAETVEDSVRGALASYLILFGNAGLVFAYIVGSVASYYTHAYIMIQIPILYLICYIWMPETPIYLINTGRNIDAERSLRWLRGDNDDLLQKEMHKTVSFIKERKALPEAASIKDIFTSVGSRKALIIGTVLVANLQFCGIYAILSYAVNIFQEAGSGLSPHTSSIIIGLVQFAGSCASALLIDKAGRKILLLISNASMAICLAAIGVYFFLKYLEKDTTSIGWLPVTCLSIFIFAIALGLAPVTFIKGKATTIIVSIMWFLSFLMAKFYPSMTDVLGIHGCYWFFSICCILGVFYCLFAVPETKNRVLNLYYLNSVDINRTAWLKKWKIYNCYFSHNFVFFYVNNNFIN
ncbi:hypothetical protein L9F63_011744 [Diploptera punctata]|uniref:Facilitated trehalose transporter Tret1 n=1 Tax=Diploptera punctata TaxID=6984 RepID=A0AAD8AE28_DIPPU|nr:hypothetical protein L9F63_011744 [Diploptera punctata]